MTWLASCIGSFCFDLVCDLVCLGQMVIPSLPYLLVWFSVCVTSVPISSSLICTHQMCVSRFVTLVFNGRVVLASPYSQPGSVGWAFPLSVDCSQVSCNTGPSHHMSSIPLGILVRTDLLGIEIRSVQLKPPHI